MSCKQRDHRATANATHVTEKLSSESHFQNTALKKPRLIAAVTGRSMASSQVDVFEDKTNGLKKVLLKGPKVNEEHSCLHV